MKKFNAALVAVLLSGGAIFGGATAAGATVQECIPVQEVAAYDETVTDAAAYDETVTDTAAYDETVVDTPAGWQRYSWTGGPLDESTVPTFPSESWQANVAGDPHGVGVAGAYFRSNGGSGKGDWFYLEATPPVTHVVHHDAVTHVVHHDAVTHVIHHDAIPAVVCENDEEDTDYVTVAWKVADLTDIFGTTQTYVLSQGTEEPELNVLDGQLNGTCFDYQIDVYYDDETTAALIAGGELYGPNDPTEHLIPGGLGTAWKFIDNPECEVVTNTYCEVPASGPTSTDLNDLWGNVDTRTAGHVDYVNDGLHIWTTDNSSQAKVSEGYPASFDLKNTGQLELDWTGTTPPPGINLFVTFEDGKNGTLVYESVYGQDLWLTNGSNADVKANAPVNGGGNGSQWHGTIDQWLSVYPDAHVNAIAYSLGSGVLGDGVINSITAGCTTYYFDKVPTIEVEPPVIHVENGEWVGAPECGEDSYDRTRDVVTTTTTFHIEVVEGQYVQVADEPTSVVTHETETVEVEVEACPEVVVPPTTPPTTTTTVVEKTVPTETLASTGVNNVQVLLLIALGLAALSLFLFVIEKVRRRTDKPAIEQE